MRVYVCECFHPWFVGKKAKGRISYPLITKKCLFFGNFDVLCFLKTPVWDHPFALLSTDYFLLNFLILAKRKKCPHLELFWSVFSRTRNEYSVLCISPYLVRMRENTDQNNSEYGHSGPYFSTFWTFWSRINPNTDYSGPYFSAFGLNTMRFEVRSIQSKCGEMRTRIAPNADTFLRSLVVWHCSA